MSFDRLVSTAVDKQNFLTIENYIDFAKRYLDFAVNGLQAVIVSQNENHYQFYQYKADGHYNITRPLNSLLMYSSEDENLIDEDFLDILDHIRDIPESDSERRNIIVRAIYTMQRN